MKRYIKAGTVDVLDEPLDVQISLADDENTSPRILSRLVHTNSTRVLDLLARNPNTPPAALAEIYNEPDQSDSVRAGVLKNPNVPRDVIDSVFLALVKVVKEEGHGFLDFDEAKDRDCAKGDAKNS